MTATGTCTDAQGWRKWYVNPVLQHVSDTSFSVTYLSLSQGDNLEPHTLTVYQHGTQNVVATATVELQLLDKEPDMTSLYTETFLPKTN